LKTAAQIKRWKFSPPYPMLWVPYRVTLTSVCLWPSSLSVKTRQSRVKSHRDYTSITVSENC